MLTYFKKRRIAQIIEGMFVDGDYFWNKTVFSLHGGRTDLTNNSTFIDSSSLNHAVTSYGDACQTLVTPFVNVGGSVYLDGTGDYLTIPSDQAHKFGTANFTIECWFKTSTVTGGPRTLFSTSMGSYGIEVAQNGGNLTFSASSYGTSWDIINSLSISAINVDTWYHLAVVRNGDVLDCYVNGSIHTAFNIYSAPVFFGPNAFGIGSNGTNTFNGFISNFRVVMGAAVYTNVFNIPTNPLTAISGTTLLLNFENGAIVDSSRNVPIYLNGNAVASDTMSKFGSTSIALDGSGDYVRAGTPNSWTFLHDNTATYTVEFWFNTSVQGVEQGLFSTGSTAAGNGLSIGITTANTLSVKMYRGVAGNYYTWGETGTAVTTNAWHHVAFVWRGIGQGSLFLDGQLIDSTLTMTGTWPAYATTVANALHIGCHYNGSAYSYFTGNIDDVRVSKGIARYYGNFSLMTKQMMDKQASGYTPGKDEYWNQTLVSLPLYDSNSTDAKGNTFTASGNVTYSTTSPKFGSSALNFAGGRLTSAVGSYAIRGDFTLECWVRLNAYRLGTICGIQSTLAGHFPVLFAINGFGGISLYRSSSATDRIIKYDTKIFDLNTWYHLAFVRSNGYVSVFVNGVKIVTANNSEMYGGDSAMTIGNDSYNDWFSGQLTDFRFTNGVARYTSNFTVPSSPFPTVGLTY